jgi:pilus assembly protein FimV
MKRLLANSLLLAGGLTLSSELLALGLGEMTLKSALNQPLNAEIQLVDAGDLTQWEIKPSLASANDFERAGVDRYYFLTKIQFKVEGNRVVVTSKEAINEPFLNFLVELNWPSGRVLREYTVLLDPPVFQETRINPLVDSPTSAVASTTSARSQQPVAAPVAGAQSSYNRWANEAAAPGTYKVQPNDTLWQIAVETRPDRAVSPQQMMIALQNANPSAFIDSNINRLKSHQILRIPTADEIRGVPTQQAVAEVARQNQAIKAGAAQIDATGRKSSGSGSRASDTGGEVRLVTAPSQDKHAQDASGDVGRGGASRQDAIEADLSIALENLDKGRRENEELAKRLAALEEQIDTLQRLVALKDDQLASMQIGRSNTENAETEVNPQVTDAVVSKPIDAATASAIIDEETADAETAKDYNYTGDADSKTSIEPSAKAAVNTEAEAIKARKERIAKLLAAEEAAKAKDESILDQIMAFSDVLLIGAGVLLVGLLVQVGLRRRKKPEGEHLDKAADFEKPVVTNDGQFDNELLDDFDLSEDDLTVAETDLDEDNLDLDEFTDVDDDKYETIAQTEDAISESEIYIAYGKFDQAIDLLSSAIKSEPSRTDLRLKLLELYTEVDDAKAFAKAEGELSELGDIAASTQAEDLRKRLSSPLDPVVTGAAIAAGTASLDEENDEFAGGLDFSDALDFGDDTETVTDDRLGKSLEDVPSLDLDASVDFDVAREGSPVSLDTPDLDDALDTESDEIEFDTEQSTELSEKKVDDELDEFDFDLGDDADEPLEFDQPAVTEAPVITEKLATDTDVFDFSEDEVDAELDLESIDFAKEPEAAGVEDEAPDSNSDDDLAELTEMSADVPVSEPEDDVLAFDMDAETGFESDDSDIDLQSLEAELDAIGRGAEDAAIVSGADDLDDAIPMTEVKDDLADAEEELAEFDLAVADGVEAQDDIEAAIAEDDDLSILDGLNVNEDNSDNADELIGGIDLDELAASDDEFDFLAGSDECATKLDLARAYIDMEDVEGAKELLQEVVQEGSDQQKQDARELMDNLA